MDKKNNFALVRKPLSAVEKAAPGAKRILSGMVADAHALAKNKERKKLRIVMVNDEPAPLEAFDLIIRHWIKDVVVLSFDNAITALEELSQTNPDLLITDDRMPGMFGGELCQRLLDRGVRYPIIVNSPWEPTEQWVQKFAKEGLNVSFLSVPIDSETFRKTLETSLKIKIPHDTQPKKAVSGIK